MKDTFYFSVPGIINLTKESGWKVVDEKDTVYFVYRVHFAIKKRAVEDSVRKGEIIQVFEKPERVSINNKVLIEISQEKVLVEEILRQNSFEKEIIDEIKSGFTLGQNELFDTSFKNNFKDIVINKYTEYIKDIHTIKTNNTKTDEISITLDHYTQQNLFCVNVYQRYAYDIYIVGVDYLCVEYKRSLFGVRRKRSKRPKLSEIRSAPSNYIQIKRLICSIEYWKNIPRSTVIVPEDKYQREVKDPEEFSINFPDNNTTTKMFLPKDLSPSLYRIANAAFPLKWIHRKTQWTKEELMQLEEEDYKECFSII